MAIQDTVQRGRALTEKYMPLTVEAIGTSEGYTDPGGYYQPGEETVLATGKGRLGKLSGSEAVVAQQLSELVEGSLFVPVDFPIEASQQVRVDGVKFNIKSVVLGTEPYMAQREVLIARAG